MTELEIPLPGEEVQATAETEFASFLAMVRNSVGSGMFRNLFVRRDGATVDALHDGVRSCAFYVSSILTIFKKIGSFHATVGSTVRDLEECGWRRVDGDLAPGDVLVWGPSTSTVAGTAHIGYYVGDDLAVSTSYETGTPILHHDHPNHAWSSIIRAYRLPDWRLG